MRKNVLSLVLLGGIFGLGCAKTNSDNIKTSGFYASYQVLVNATNPSVATCSASFQVEAGGTFIDLSSNDSVTCNGQSMTRSELAGIVSYSANLTATTGATYTVVLTRAGESPYSASVTLPEPVANTSPASGTSFTKGNSLAFSWTASGNASDWMNVSTSRVTSGDSACPSEASFDDSAPENGSGSFSSTEMSLTTNGTAGACAMKINWKRYRAGTMPSGLNGVINAVQATSASITLN